MNNAMYWFTHDLRVSDNQGLAIAQQASSLLCVYAVEQSLFEKAQFQSNYVSDVQWRFIIESLNELNQSLNESNQGLHVVSGNAVGQLANLIDSHNIDTLIISRQNGTNEQKLLNTLTKLCPHLMLVVVDNYTLFNLDSSQSLTRTLPKHFTPFRKLAEELTVTKCNAKPQQLPPSPLSFSNVLRLPDWLLVKNSNESKFKGGEKNGLKHLSEYFDSSLPNSYKLTRNALDGWSNSSKFSPWLAVGCLSARQIYWRLKQYQAEHGVTESSDWIAFELMWREYFQWLAFKLGSKLYHFQGSAKATPLTSFYPLRFLSWAQGKTQYPLVNAIMGELVETGYISNRSRQIAASCLVNDLSVDWRYGAAFFQAHLIDYDVAVNWGNWQYIAGVGCDPRGGRHFNIEKQTTLFDPNGEYVACWLGDGQIILDTVDAVDWPLLAEN